MSSSGGEPEDLAVPAAYKPFDIEESFRYQPLGLLGRGGMGEVRAALDLRLDREVALKVLQRSDPQSEARMVREASLAARLDHPGIVPVLSAGRLPDGRAYYTMRVIRGQSLAEALARAPDLAARLRLVRPLLDATEAVAYAHDKGVLHRDLKPANVMMGEHGGTVVVDWGLAVLLDDAPEAPIRPPVELPAPAAATWAPEPGAETVPFTPRLTAAPAPGATFPPVEPSASTLPPDAVMHTGAAEWELTRPGQVFGTPAFMPPEQARGETLGRPADVYALGGILFQILTGRPPRMSADPTEPVPAVADLCPGAPPELVAITSRAMAPDPAQRYPDAAALAADLEAWFEGRRVGAYEYTRWELLKRLVTAWRVPIAVGAVALICLGAAVGIGWWRTLTERNKALQAETSAVMARAQSDLYLADALLAQARVARDRGQRARAELLAAHRLRLGENAEARGILALFNGVDRPRLVSRLELSACEGLSLDGTRTRLACVLPDEIVILSSKGETLGRIAGHARWATYAGPGLEQLVVMDDQDRSMAFGPGEAAPRTLSLPRASRAMSKSSNTGELALYNGPTTTLYNVGTGEVREAPRCNGERMRAVSFDSLPSGRSFIVCPGPNGIQTLSDVGPDGSRTDLFTIDEADGVVTELYVEDDPGGRVLLGTERGALYVWSPPTGELRRAQTDLPDIATLSSSGDRVVLNSLRGWVTVWDLNTLAPVLRLPDLVRLAAWSPDGTRLSTVGEEWRIWDVPPQVMPSVHQAGGGVSAVDISQDASLLAWGDGLGEARVVDRLSGATVMRLSLPGGVAKDVAISPDGRTLAAGTGGGPGAQLYDLVRRQPLSVLPSQGVRRVAWLGPDLLVAPYQREVFRWRPGAQTPEVIPGLVQLGDLDPLSDATGFTYIEDSGTIGRLEGMDGTPRALMKDVDAQASAGSKRYNYVISGGYLQIFDGAVPRTSTLLDPSCTIALDVGVSPKDRYLAVGCISGAVLVFRGSDLRLVASLPGHTGRVPSVAFDASGRWLVTGSWDGTVRVWDLSVLDRPADALVSQLEAAWGMGLPDALGD